MVGGNTRWAISTRIEGNFLHFRHFINTLNTVDLASARGCKMPTDTSIIESAMTGIPPPQDLSTSLADLAKTNGQTTSDLGMDVPRNYIEHERTLIAQIELAIKEADQGNFATEEKVATTRARRWSRNAC